MLELDLRSWRTVTRWIAGHGPDVVVLDPPDLAAAVRACWEAAARVHADGTGAASGPPQPGAAASRAGASR